MKLQLPQVTLLAIDTVTHDLTRMALEECLRHADFGSVLYFSDKEILPGAEWHGTEAFHSMDEVGRALWYEAPPAIQTSHFLFIHYDSWIVNPEAWDETFLQYDYIGAPWWYRDDCNVGNGGFSLRSAALSRRIASDPNEYRFASPEDDTLCRCYGPALKADGFKFAPTHVAAGFAFERVRPIDVDGHRIPTFGFHGMYNWPDVLNDDQIGERLAKAPAYVLHHPHAAEMRQILIQRSHGRASRSRIYQNA